MNNANIAINNVIRRANSEGVDCCCGDGGGSHPHLQGGLPGDSRPDLLWSIKKKALLCEGLFFCFFNSLTKSLDTTKQGLT